MSFSDIAKGMKDYIKDKASALKPGEKAPVLSEVVEQMVIENREDMFFDSKVYNHSPNPFKQAKTESSNGQEFKRNSDRELELERYAVNYDALKGFTQNQKMDSLSKELISKFLGNSLDKRNPVIQNELQGFIKSYMDYNQTMTEEGKVPFGITIDRKYGSMHIVGANSSVQVYTNGNLIVASHETHAYEDAETKMAIKDSQNGNNTIPCATLQLLDKGNGVALVQSGILHDKTEENIDGQAGVFTVYGSSQTKYYDENGKEYPVDSKDSSQQIHYWKNSLGELNTLSIEGNFSDALTKIETDIMTANLDQKGNQPPMPEELYEKLNAVSSDQEQ